MLKLAGAALIAGGALMIRQRLLLAGKRERETLDDLAAALACLERGVRTSLRPLPRLLEERGIGRYADEFFERVLAARAADADRPLSDCWREAARRLALSARERETLARVSDAFGGEEEGLLSALHGALEELNAARRERARTAREDARLINAVCLSAGTLLTILLI